MADKKFTDNVVEVPLETMNDIQKTMQELIEDMDLLVSEKYPNTSHPATKRKHERDTNVIKRGLAVAQEVKHLLDKVT